MEGPDDIIIDPSPASLVRKLWFGPTSSIDQNDLKYGSNSWPITLIHQILVRCTSLRSLAVICVSQARWYRIAGVIPPSVTSLCLGPVHGEVDYRHLPCGPNLRCFTSLDTFMLDSEIRDIVLSPSIRTIRRAYSLGDRLTLAFDQLECVARATVLERLEIVCFAETAEGALRVLEETAEGYEYDRSRVVLVPKSCWSDVHEQRDPIAAVFKDWIVAEIL